jgi:hypothetical protein
MKKNVQIHCQNARIKVFDSSLTTNIHKHVFCGLPCFLGISILSHMVCSKFSPFHLYRWAKVETLHYRIKIFILKTSKVSNFYFILQWVNQNGSLKIQKVTCQMKSLEKTLTLRPVASIIVFASMVF